MRTVAHITTCNAIHTEITSQTGKGYLSQQRNSVLCKSFIVPKLPVYSSVRIVFIENSVVISSINGGKFDHPRFSPIILLFYRSYVITSIIKILVKNAFPCNYTNTI